MYGNAAEAGSAGASVLFTWKTEPRAGADARRHITVRARSTRTLQRRDPAAPPRPVGAGQYLADMTLHLDRTRAGYDALSVEYAEFVRHAMEDEHLDRAMVLAFAALVRTSGTPTVIDVGCGPGHITDLLAGEGLLAAGIDLSPAMVTIAGARRPDLTFRTGSLLDLDEPDGRWGGVLAHYSIIHTPPDEMPRACAELARVLAPGGYALLAFQSGDDSLTCWAAFDHRVAPGYRWATGAVVDLLASAGLTEVASLRVMPGPRQRFCAGYVLARKPPAAEYESEPGP